MTAAEDKQHLRRQLRRLRRRLRSAERREASRVITQHLVQLEAWRRARTVGLFASSHEEVDTSTLIDIARSEGKRVVLPRVDLRDAPLSWREAGAPGRKLSLVVGDFGIQEPPASAPVVEPSQVDLVVVPCLAIDPRGYRVGYGGGYYDRTLALARADAVRVAVCFALQQLDEVPVEPHDVPVHWQVSEAGILAS